jgi:hypothetical protein
MDSISDVYVEALQKIFEDHASSSARGLLKFSELHSLCEDLQLGERAATTIEDLLKDPAKDTVLRNFAEYVYS